MSKRDKLRLALQNLNLTPRFDHIVGNCILIYDEKGHMACANVTSINLTPEGVVSFRVEGLSFYDIYVKKIVPSNNGTATVYSEFDELSWVCSFELVS